MWSSALPILLFHHTFSLSAGGQNTPVPGVRCPCLQVEDWRFPQTARCNITGFDLVQRFSLLKIPEVEKIRNSKGSVIVRLGKVEVSTPTQEVFPHGLPAELTMVFTLLLKKRTAQDQVHLLQVLDQQGEPQFSLDLNGTRRTLSLRWAAGGGAGQREDLIGCEFSGEGAGSLFDGRWHKAVLSLQVGVASLYVDCSSIETHPMGPRAELPQNGLTRLGISASTAAPAPLEVQQVMVYCNPAVGIQEVCCEIPGAWLFCWALCCIGQKQNGAAL
ncbi:hypothetical protein AGOR_G00101400 [Albula goreensis]|uniref:Thrombospondin-like N-terminal domain-containing protein n=1 Tax=Albula goreensis TaxID=1534307 RepID=A0A8T3DCM0_9TELE|nr:hypothetical protein AGOR_G00101400 [Albula goreensis]